MRCALTLLGTAASSRQGLRRTNRGTADKHRRHHVWSGRGPDPGHNRGRGRNRWGEQLEIEPQLAPEDGGGIVAALRWDGPVTALPITGSGRLSYLLPASLQPRRIVSGVKNMSAGNGVCPLDNVELRTSRSTREPRIERSLWRRDRRTGWKWMVETGNWRTGMVVASLRANSATRVGRTQGASRDLVDSGTGTHGNDDISGHN